MSVTNFSRQDVENLFPGDTESVDLIMASIDSLNAGSINQHDVLVLLSLIGTSLSQGIEIVASRVDESALVIRDLLTAVKSLAEVVQRLNTRVEALEKESSNGN